MSDSRHPSPDAIDALFRPRFENDFSVYLPDGSEDLLSSPNYTWADHRHSSPERIDGSLPLQSEIDSAVSAPGATQSVLISENSFPNTLGIRRPLSWNGTWTSEGEAGSCVSCGTRGLHIHGKVEQWDIDSLIHNVMEISDRSYENPHEGHIVALSTDGSSPWLEHIRRYRKESQNCKFFLSCSAAILTSSRLKLRSPHRLALSG